MKIILRTSVWLFIFSALVYAQQKTDEHPEIFNFSCQTCHLCDKPTKKDPCLRDCPRAEMITIHHKPAEGPVEVVMAEFTAESKTYQPVRFSHRVHSEMSGMAGGCALCHHNNPPGNILPCRDCHVRNRAREDISLPDLMAAYHRQCMECHRAWSGSMSCTSCHAARTEAVPVQHVSEPPSPENRVHPEISEPEKLVYRTDYEDGPVVTFYHDEHVNVFGFECTDCHRRESCIRCHDRRRKATPAILSHDRCADCHTTDDACGHCHREREQTRFDHFKRTGFAIDGFHKRLKCKACHGLKLKNQNPVRDCRACHAAWSVGTFDHSITGVVLDETHREIECEACHIDRIFSNAPDCASCHDDMTYPAAVPGRKGRR